MLKKLLVAVLALTIIVGFCGPAGSSLKAAPNPLDQWPTWCHDYGRTSESGISLGDVSGIRNAWSYFPGGGRQMRYTAPLIVNDKVYVFFTGRVMCLNLQTGAVIWTSSTKPWSALCGSLMSDPTIVDGFLYMGTGTTNGFIKVDALTGDKIWSRDNVVGGTPLPGAGDWFQNAPPVILGDYVYFCGDYGGVYGLDKLTGLITMYTFLDVVQGLPLGDDPAAMMASMSSDGVANLFIGTSNLEPSGTGYPTAGGVYSLTPVPTGVDMTGTFTTNWNYVPGPEWQTYCPGGFLSAPTHYLGNLYLNSWSDDPYGTGYLGFRQKLDVATGTAQWLGNGPGTGSAMIRFQGAAWNSPPAVISSLGGVIFGYGNFLGGAAANSRGVRRTSFANSTNTAFLAANNGISDYDNNVHGAAVTTQDPYVLYGGNYIATPLSGTFKIVDGNTGARLVTYGFTGYVNGSALAHGTDDGLGYGNDWIVVTTRFSDYNTAIGGIATNGKVFAFRNMGPRPRLVVPETFVTFDPVFKSEPNLVQRTDLDAVKNTGLLPLTYSTFGHYATGAMSLTAKISTVSAVGQRAAANLSKQFIDNNIDEMLPDRTQNRFHTTPNGLTFVPFVPEAGLTVGHRHGGGEWMGVDSPVAVKPAVANSALGTAANDWAAWVSGSAGVVGGGGSANFVFQFDRSKMAFLGYNTFFIQIASNDPDYNIENPWSPPDPILHQQAEIQYVVPYNYCPTEIDEMWFGDYGYSWTDNIGMLGNDPSVAFSLGAGDDNLFTGTMFYANDMMSAAWNPISGTGSYDALLQGGFLYGYYPTGTDCGGCLKGYDGNVLPVEYSTDGGYTYPDLIGDLCTWSMIDSGQLAGFTTTGTNPGLHQGGPSMGIQVNYREIGGYPSEFGNFKLVVQDIINRNATDITGLYYGSFIDWDVSAADDGDGDVDKGWIYQFGPTGDVYGQIGLPSKGSHWPDGTATDPMYNGQILHSIDTYWKNEQFDSLYNWVDLYPEAVTKLAPVEDGTDYATEVAFGKTTLHAYDTTSFGYALFGMLGTWSQPDLENLRNFANKFAGFGRGDVNDDGVIDLLDLVILQQYVAAPLVKPGPFPFKHLGDLDNDGDVDLADVTYFGDYFFTYGPPPKSAFVF
ncbi:MAG: PQQ-binding-like beta-propeller repeat protein [candidate division Zixibacteria bacterium]|nr:PQQ-binding-like beta-propeller repeat protein [candidate division Zixibacteria bacterium]